MTRQTPHGDPRIRAAARAVSLAEATSFLLLLVATAVKYAAEHPQGVRVLGPIHGVLFLAYCALVGYLAFTERWARRRTILALVASVLPVAPFFVERHWLRDPAAPPAATTAPPAAKPASRTS
ncbi:DUF3817 domain-containing protein [Frankia sp. AgKG'84/4]|uniref:DUF3817 domain-containing protein n=1 Tax=Frankia sp. AgKG'84/4 TaxID=573490 RepID=UPI00200E1210|nr:DUF3817 domain-containing protein [Frankia sp. AgKG'84/4]MCL9798167.1 DUF3817 domain-containing protein [Frankia sp. AgKG'84/4]